MVDYHPTFLSVALAGVLSNTGLLSILQVKLVRDPEEQVTVVGVPEEHLAGHAFHMYHLTSPDGT